ncbi:hypothetical protein A1O3_05596 [Capronia epimyces CBS 606.96]|uniref:CorA-like transporter domain-containing protein n=1 Tax=Capronia epimyces CBS 606.96 TaxID=1182542 RepID=W9Y6S8_9EURO|nr:uncharacterized protein A1O3_05596 [Capronia epimyces CBS 606.96]EXJ84921.1 hypothetical protein A1O3_05596 [Capronia epimyces CBS 606.96]
MDADYIKYRTLEVAYALKFPEPRALSGDKSQLEWSIRQIGIYQKYDTTIKQSTWILVFPNRESTTRDDLARKLDPQRGEYPNPILDHPLSIHLFLFAERVQNWRFYISHFENEVWKLGNLTVTIDIGDALPFQETYTDLSTLHYLESRLAPLRAIFAATKRLAEALGRINDQLGKEGHVTQEEAFEMQELLTNLISRIHAYSDNIEFNLSKISRITELLAGTISLKSQHTSEDMSNRIYDLTKSALEDSSSMRVTTFTTLLFLPSTFVAVFIIRPLLCLLWSMFSD